MILKQAECQSIKMMTKTEMQNYWLMNFPLCPPINFLFKQFYQHRWLRIHSLIDSKRYSETQAEWDELWNTQNEILNDVFPENDEIIIFSGEYSDAKISLESTEEKHIALKQFNFIELQKINMYAITKQYQDEDSWYTPMFATQVFKPFTLNTLLYHIATDEVRIFFLNPKTKTIVAPYDGGVDIIYADQSTRDLYKIKYNKFTQQHYVD